MEFQKYGLPHFRGIHCEKGKGFEISTYGIENTLNETLVRELGSEIYSTISLHAKGHSKPLKP